MTQTRLRTALVLAGRRATGDALARSEGVSHKALLPVNGVAMGIRVLRALSAMPGFERIAVSCDDSQLVTRLESLMADLRPGLRLEHHPSARSPAASLGEFIGCLADGEIALVTTADHPLLRTEIVRYFVEKALALDADLVAGVVSEREYRQRFPSGPRTFVRFADEAISGANLFLVRAPRAVRVAQFWVRLEGVRKRPWRLVSHFGVATLLRFLTGKLTLARALAEASRVIGARIETVFLPFAEAALDVDRPADLAMVQALVEGAGAVEKVPESS
jgi:CMP-2-keto-3-deoxyoctulosonic acid synthetase